MREICYQNHCQLENEVLKLNKEHRHVHAEFAERYLRQQLF